ncbi:hypothetical protein [Duganella sp. sic0402]|uniref:hypothetical protein n=1 Tax=Duganella sp. sic0402 TaxID=2854786 RepID=UPI0035A28EF9
MKIADKWVLLLGGRHDKVRQDQCDYFDASVCGVAGERSSATTGRAGVVYQCADRRSCLSTLPDAAGRGTLARRRTRSQRPHRPRCAGSCHLHLYRCKDH